MNNERQFKEAHEFTKSDDAIILEAAQEHIRQAIICIRAFRSVFEIGDRIAERWSWNILEQLMGCVESFPDYNLDGDGSVSFTSSAVEKATTQHFFGQYGDRDYYVQEANAIIKELGDGLVVKDEEDLNRVVGSLKESALPRSEIEVMFSGVKRKIITNILAAPKKYGLVEAPVLIGHYWKKIIGSQKSFREYKKKISGGTAAIDSRENNEQGEN